MDGVVATTIQTFTREMFPGQALPAGVANAGALGSIEVFLDFTKTLGRVSLQEDPAAGDDDEIRVRIDLTMGEFPLRGSGTSNIVIVAG